MKQIMTNYAHQGAMSPRVDCLVLGGPPGSAISGIFPKDLLSIGVSEINYSTNA